ncbi:MAG: DUF192 domain-containing protein [Candidatus Omnitrophica bacterium]|nr:DUF192 domain-containing protein [Candidatus Omnitrophota bacterium]
MKEAKKQKSIKARKGRSENGWAIFVLCYFVLSFPACSRMGNEIKRICFNGRCIKAEVARTPEARAQGLQGRDSMPYDEGMLFVFPSSNRQSFWMKDTYIPLDIIWMDSRKRVVFIIPNVSYPVKPRSARYILLTQMQAMFWRSTPGSAWKWDWPWGTKRNFDPYKNNYFEG